MPRTWFVLAWLLAVACTGVGLVAGCGSSPAKAEPPLDAGDATAEGAVPEAGLDAGPDIAQDPDVYPTAITRSRRTLRAQRRSRPIPPTGTSS